MILARVYDAGVKYAGGDRYTVYFPIPNQDMRKNNITTSDRRLKLYRGFWISAQPLGEQVNVLTTNWVGKNGPYATCLGKRIDFDILPKGYQDWCKKKERLWLRAWRLDTDEAWNEFFEA